MTRAERTDCILDAYLDGFLDARERDTLIEVELVWEVDAVAAGDDTPNAPYFDSA
jgi:hypothetical protein